MGWFNHQLENLTSSRLDLAIIERLRREMQRMGFEFYVPEVPYFGAPFAP